MTNFFSIERVGLICGLTIVAVFAICAIGIGLTYLVKRSARQYAILSSVLACVLSMPLVAAVVYTTGASWIELPVLPRSISKTDKSNGMVAYYGINSSKARHDSEVFDHFKSLDSTSEFEFTNQSGKIAEHEEIDGIARMAPIYSERNKPSSFHAFLPADGEHHTSVTTSSGEGGQFFLIRLLLLTWASVSIALLFRLIRQVVVVERLLRSADTVTDKSILQSSRAAAEFLDLPKIPRLLATTKIQTPIAAGLRDTAVLIPHHLASSISQAQLQDVLTHEFAHVKRRDPLGQFFQSIATCLFWPVPLLHIVNQRLSKAREEVCDNFVLARRDPLEYGETLYRIAGFAHRKKISPVGIGMLTWRGALEDRIAHLVDECRDRSTKTRGFLTGLVAFVLLLVGTTICGINLVAAEAVKEAANKTPSLSQVNGSADRDKIQGAPAELEQIDYTVRVNTSPEAMRWEVRVKARGLQEYENISLRLQDWGEWSRVDSLFLRNLQSNVGLVSEGPTRKNIQVEADWNGDLEVTYHVMMTKHGSKAHELIGLMPWTKGNYGQGFTSNTLFEIYVDDQPVKAKRRIEINANPGSTIVTGWDGISQDQQVVTIDKPIGNTSILFGQALDSSSGKVGSASIDIIQFGQGVKRAERLLPGIQNLLTSFGTESDMELDHPIRVILTDTGGGGVNVDGALIAGYDSQSTNDHDLLFVLSHELFHEWLGGGYIPMYDQRMVWFKEGFTEYLSIWHLAHTGLINEEQFLGRLKLLEQVAQTSPVYSTIAFGDKSVQWRDGDGPNEKMAYFGAAMLALQTDVQLRRLGKSNLNKIVADFVKLNREVKFDDIQKWYSENGLEEFFNSHITGHERSELASVAEFLGCEVRLSSDPVAYAGIATDGNGYFGTITGLDPDGIAMKAGVQIGDRITGFWPVKARKLQLSQKLTVKYPFGMDAFEVGKQIHFQVRRGEKNLRFDMYPKTLDDVAVKSILLLKDDSKLNKFLDR